MILSTEELFFQFLWTQSDALLPQDLLRGIVHFGSAAALSRAHTQDWAALGFSATRIQKMTQVLAQRSTFEKSFASLSKYGIQMVSYFSDTYPKALKQVASPPVLLFFRGAWPQFEHERCLAVVGTRRATDYGQRVLRQILPPLCAAGLTLVSGLAFGIDAWAHQITVSNAGRAVAVLAKGVEQASPRAHQGLFDRVVDSGCVLSEFAFSEGLSAWHFPRRNRIVSGLCEAVLVVEAPEKSGAVITAHFALEQNRQVYAVPGSLLQTQSQGCLQLIQQGAKMVRVPSDILDDYALATNAKIIMLPQMSPVQRRIYEFCSGEAKYKDDVFALFPENFSEVSMALTELELLGLIAVSGAKVSAA